MFSQHQKGNAVVSFCRRTKLITGLFLTIFLVGCASTASVKQIDRLDRVGVKPKILIMAPDVKYYLITASGVTQPHAEWTEAARINFADSLQDYANERNIEVISGNNADQLTDAEISYQKLYSAVGASILSHYFNTGFSLPTKQGAFDWSLGPGVEVIGKQYAADYALFSYYRDYQASGGQVAQTIILGVLTGAQGNTGSERGFASLVDLRTGDIVWFNQVTNGAGELRDKDGARATIDALFKNLPEG